MISFYCNCGQLMTVRDDFAGRQGNCPRCRAPFTVPHQGQAATQQPQAQQPQAQQPQAAPSGFGAPPAPGSTSREPYDSAAIIRAAQQAKATAQPPVPPPRGGRTRAGVLEVVHGPSALKGKTYTLLSGPTVLGRDPGADLTIESDRVSRRHCQFEPTGDGRYAVVDLGSANGTLVNQSRINGRKMLSGGEYIQAGDCLFRYSLS